ncbi:hypothetical protein [Noviherbaspirillum malthae]|jgi:hypothetical protein|uniref:hypothetical protein n=1 Tax=Noviherbaspirillum malthae TaxID=1260987 RepID=UPI00188FB034|nr:hypothetical protein [Noviherbaspirillum malthae]
MNNDDETMHEEMSLLDAIAESIQNTGASVHEECSGVQAALNKGTGAPQQMYLDVFEVMLSLIHSAATVQEQIIHLRDMAQWLHDEADRFQTLGQGTLLLKTSNMRH